MCGRDSGARAGFGSVGRLVAAAHKPPSGVGRLEAAGDRPASGVGRLVAAADRPPSGVGRTVKVVPCTCGKFKRNFNVSPIKKSIGKKSLHNVVGSYQCFGSRSGPMRIPIDLPSRIRISKDLDFLDPDPGELKFAPKYK